MLARPRGQPQIQAGAATASNLPAEGGTSRVLFKSRSLARLRRPGKGGKGEVKGPSMSTAVGAVSGEADGQLLSSTVTGDRRNRGDVEKGETVWDERTDHVRPPSTANKRGLISIIPAFGRQRSASPNSPSITTSRHVNVPSPLPFSRESEAHSQSELNGPSGGTVGVGSSGSSKGKTKSFFRRPSLPRPSLNKALSGWTSIRSDKTQLLSSGPTPESSSSSIPVPPVTQIEPTLPYRTLSNYVFPPPTPTRTTPPPAKPGPLRDAELDGDGAESLNATRCTLLEPLSNVISPPRFPTNFTPVNIPSARPIAHRLPSDVVDSLGARTPLFSQIVVATSVANPNPRPSWSSGHLTFSRSDRSGSLLSTEAPLSRQRASISSVTPRYLPRSFSRPPRQPSSSLSLAPCPGRPYLGSKFSDSTPESNATPQSELAAFHFPASSHNSSLLACYTGRTRQRSNSAPSAFIHSPLGPPPSPPPSPLSAFPPPPRPSPPPTPSLARDPIRMVTEATQTNTSSTGASYTEHNTVMHIVWDPTPPHSQEAQGDADGERRRRERRHGRSDESTYLYGAGPKGRARVLEWQGDTMRAGMGSWDPMCRATASKESFKISVRSVERRDAAGLGSSLEVAERRGTQVGENQGEGNREGRSEDC